MLEERQHVREGHRLADAEQLQPHRPRGRLDGTGERQGEVRSRRPDERLDALDVAYCAAGVDVLPVCGGERVAVAAEQLDRALLAVVLDELLGQVVGPRSHDVGQPQLDLGDVDLAVRAVGSTYTMTCSRASTDSEIRVVLSTLDPSKADSRIACTRCSTSVVSRSRGT